MLKNKKRIYILSAIVIIIIIIISSNLIKSKKEKEIFLQEQERVQQYTNLKDFKSIDEVFTYLNCTLISKEDSDIENIDYILKVKLKYELDQSYSNYYEKLIQYAAYTLEYKNFYIIDEKQNIEILVMCDSEKQSVLKYYINDIENYFERNKTEKNIDEYTQVNQINVNIASNILNKLIQQNWKTANIELGSYESTYRKYDIYFDEGYEIRKVDGKVFNIIFTSKYQGNVLENISVNTSKEDIVKMLGKPEFEYNNLIGYKTNDFYVFFNENSEISIYPVVEYDTDLIIDIIQKYENTNNLIDYINEIKDVWKDYDIYNYDTNYVVLQYTLKGICFKYDQTAQKGVVLYSNYNGNVSLGNTLKEILESKSKLPNNMYFENSDLVFNQEIARVSSLDDYSEFRNYNSYKILNISKKFKVNVDTNGQVRFISINKEFPNSELRETIDYGIWLDDYNFIYSVKNRGIYKYNLNSRIYSTIIEGNEKFQIYQLDGHTLQYDETSISVE